ncbi:putative ABC transport system permease protein [Kineothrix alysoides]|uniref:Putative ABC transport system permease protein n=2 Tax=Kineothrix alysoides TaxID=1469948 RepID=A0A4R1QY64_9FIRM|nr:putative ABC transport system permease protein [Kineothrix alysoides]
MYSNFIKNDIRKSKLITATITAFILIAAMLTALAASLTVNLSGAVDNILLSAKAIHFIQMHTGDVDMEQLRNFAADQESVEDYQVLPFLNIDGAEIVIGDNSLADSVQDNGFSIQSEKFDFLLGLDNKIISPSNGEIYFPIYYMQEGNAKLGDKVTIHGVDFTVAGFLRDSTMNAALVSSKRFLVSEADFERILEFGQLEQLIEFRLCDGVSYADFETAYLDAGLPANGPPAITYAQIRLVNGLTDGIMIGVLALIVILVIIVAFLCIRFTLLAKIEEDYREIGVLKAVGMRVSSIKKLYLAKYSVIAGIACMLGFLLSVPLSEPFKQNIRLYMGESDRQTFLLGLLCGFVGAAAIYGVVLMYVNGVLRRFRKISAAQAVRFGSPREKSKSARGFLLSNNRIFPRNVFLGIKDILTRKKLYVTMLTVLIISSFIMVVPQNIYNTISAKSFITYMGMGICDATLYIKPTQAEDVTQKGTEAANSLATDENVEKYTMITTKMFDMKVDDGSTQKLRVSLGDHTAYPITYTQGTVPQTASEIAISTLYADDLAKTIGDEIVLTVDGADKRLTVSGVYSDITSGGRTAQAIFETSSGDMLSVGIPITFRTGADSEAIIAQYKGQFPFAKVYGVEENISQMFGPMISSVKMASYAAIGVTVLLTVLVTVLFMKMLVAKDRYSIAILKSMGFTSEGIRRQYLTRSVIVLALGVIIGTIMANTLGEYVGVAIVSAFGATAFNFVVNPFFAYMVSPLLIATCVYIATLLGVSDIRPLKISEHIKEA